jgi:hypothetical protein
LSIAVLYCRFEISAGRCPATNHKKSEQQKTEKEHSGYESGEPGRVAAAVDVAGASLGGFGLHAFLSYRENGGSG